jgi:hypothetical protein
MVPSFKGFFLGQAIKGDVQFHGIEVLSIELEPTSLRKIGGIEDPVPPVRIVVPARADEEVPFRCSVRSSGFGVRVHHVNDEIKAELFGVQSLESPKHTLLKLKWVLRLVVDPAISGSSLGQLPFVVFSADFLAKGWIAHVQDPENKASQMREVGNAPSGSLHGRVQFYEAENDHKILRRDGDKEVDVNEAVWEKPAKCQKDSINGAGSSDHRNKLIRGKNDRANPCSDATEQEIS